MTNGLRNLILFDDLGLLQSLDRVVVCVPRPGPSFIEESLDACGVDRTRLDIRTTPIDVSVDTLVRTTPWQLWTALPVDDLIERMRRRLAFGQNEIASSRRLLVSRQDATVRRVANQEELAGALAPYGFEIVVPGQLSFRQQVDTFASAEVVVAPHGAAMTNLLFCAPGTLAIELHHADMDRPWFARLARAARLVYDHLVCGPASSSPVDMVVDVDTVLARVEAFVHR